jgi:ATP-dependent 26S proteasome regulatory subunit
VIILTGVSMKLVGPAIEMARALQPSIVVLEDVDLIAAHRDQDTGPQPLLFEVLEGMDGLAADADVAFVLTTNRPDLLEPALAQRPGRIDLGVEVPLPDLDARRALLRLYAPDGVFTPAVLDTAADRAAGTTASFAKELVRRALLDAAEAGRPPGDADLTGALDALLDESQRLTRVLLGSSGPQG